MVQHFAYKTLSQHRNTHQHPWTNYSYSPCQQHFAVFQVKLLCFNNVQQYEMSHLKTVFENLTVKKAFHWGYVSPRALIFADTCPCTNTSCRSFNTTSNTSDSVIFISKVFIILMNDFGPCFTCTGERARVRCIHSVRHFCNGIPTPEMIFMNISEWCIQSYL